MPRSYRDKRSSPWLVWLVGLIGLAGGFYGVDHGLSEQRRYLEQADNAAAEYASYAADQANQACRILLLPEQPKCLADAEREHQLSRYDKRREYGDLVAQQTSALWTNIMGIAAVTGMVLSVVGVFLVYATFRETKRTADEASRSADAFIANERGWLQVSAEVIGRVDENGIIPVRIIANAHGKSLVEVTQVKFAPLAIARFPGDDEFIGWWAPLPEERVIKPGTNTWRTLHTTKTVARKHFFGGYADYRIQFPGERRSYFIFEIYRGKDFDDGGPNYRFRAFERQGWPEDT